MENLTPKQAQFVREYLIDVDRFWSMIEIGGDDDCWPFMGALDVDGYGRFHIGTSNSASMLAHRVAHGITTGEQPEIVRHRCSIPTCCNPGHLFSGTRADFNWERAEQGLLRGVPRPSLRGEKHRSAKLTNAQAADIRAEYAAGGITQRALAAKYGVAQRAITKIVRWESFVDG